jgi:hypothetical protein
MPGSEPMLANLGEISVSQHYVYLPTGQHPIRGSTWTVRDQTHTVTRIPPYAIVLAIAFAVFCFVGLLFLLIKENRTEGYVEVAVQGDGFYHACQIRVSSPAQVEEVRRKVDYARSLAAAAR